MILYLRNFFKEFQGMHIVPTKNRNKTKQKRARVHEKNPNHTYLEKIMWALNHWGGLLIGYLNKFAMKLNPLCMRGLSREKKKRICTNGKLENGFKYLY